MGWRTGGPTVGFSMGTAALEGGEKLQAREQDGGGGAHPSAEECASGIPGLPGLADARRPWALGGFWLAVVLLQATDWGGRGVDGGGGGLKMGVKQAELYYGGIIAARGTRNRLVGRHGSRRRCFCARVVLPGQRIEW